MQALRNDEVGRLIFTNFLFPHLSAYLASQFAELDPIQGTSALQARWLVGDPTLLIFVELDESSLQAYGILEIRQEPGLGRYVNILQMHNVKRENNPTFATELLAHAEELSKSLESNFLTASVKSFRKSHEKAGFEVLRVVIYKSLDSSEDEEG